MSKPALGFIGLGNMGGPMSIRLINAGYEVFVYDRDEGALARAVSAGAKQLTSIKAVADQVETVFLSLPTPEIVDAVCLQGGGLREGSKVKQVVDLSTIGPRAAAAIAKGLLECGMVYVDSPVSGGVTGAVKGTLAVMVSCPRSNFDALDAVLSVFGKTFYLGDKAGQAQTVKLANNIMSVTAVAITSEAIVMGVKAGVDPKIMLDVINAGSGRNTASADKSMEIMVSPVLDDTYRVADVLVHELCHTTAGAMNHGVAFRKVADAMHLIPSALKGYKATSGGDAFKQAFGPIIDGLGEYPHAQLSMSTRKVQATRMLKAVCPSCGYTIRLTAKWAARGLPICHNDGSTFIQAGA